MTWGLKGSKALFTDNQKNGKGQKLCSNICLHNELVNNNFTFINKPKCFCFYDFQDSWKCQGSLKPIILDFGASKLFKLIQDQFKRNLRTYYFRKFKLLKIGHFGNIGSRLLDLPSLSLIVKPPQPPLPPLDSQA